jgi:hypothetical protein
MLPVTSPSASTVGGAFPGPTGIVRMMSFGTPQVTEAVTVPLFKTTAVVSDTMFTVTLPDAGAVAITLIVGVVNVAVSASPVLPG